MAMLLKPELYAATADETAGSVAILRGGECRRCGFIFFPYQCYGCEKCGAIGQDLVPRTLSGRGTLVSCATVHVHNSEDRLHVSAPLRPPFVIAAIRLDEGPFLRSILLGGNEHTLHCGDHLVATLVVADSGQAQPCDGETLDLRFLPTDQCIDVMAGGQAVERAAMGDEPEWHSF